MNRAILIVICDFLVSAMLSMMTGMVPAHTGGTATGLDEQTTRVLIADLHEKEKELERTRTRLLSMIRHSGGASLEQQRRLHELALQIVALRREAELLKTAEKGKLARLSAAELQKRLEEVRRRQLVAELELKDMREENARQTQALREQRSTSRDEKQERDERIKGLIATANRQQRQIEESARKLEASREELRKAEKKLSDTEKTLAVTETQHTSARRELERTETQLKDQKEETKRVRMDLDVANRRGADSRRENARLTATLNLTQRSLEDRERELKRRDDVENSLRDQVAKLREDNKVLRKEVKLREGQVKDMNRDYQKVSLELKKASHALGEAQGKIREQEKRIEDKEKEKKEIRKAAAKRTNIPENRVLPSYGNGVVRMMVEISEDRFMIDKHIGGTFYLPYIALGGKTFVVGHTSQFIGGPGKGDLPFRKIKLARLLLTVPGAKLMSASPVTAPVLVANADPRLAAVPIKLKERKPLRALTVKELKSRGAEGLFLFKATSPGNDYAELAGRCSIGPTGVFTIRNSGVPSELRAAPGDLILTRAGEFAGIVAAQENIQGSARNGDRARVFVIPDAKVWNAPKFRLVYAKRDNEKYYTAFAETARKLREALQPQRRKH